MKLLCIQAVSYRRSHKRFTVYITMIILVDYLLLYSKYPVYYIILKLKNRKPYFLDVSVGIVTKLLAR